MQQTQEKVFSVDELPWHDPKGLPGLIGHAFGEKTLVHDPSYTTAYSMTMARFAPGIASKRHVEKWNHAIYVMDGTGEVEIDGKTWPLSTGTLIKVKAGEWHTISNTGSGNMIMMVIYDPPLPIVG